MLCCVFLAANVHSEGAFRSFDVGSSYHCEADRRHPSTFLVFVSLMLSFLQILMVYLEENSKSVSEKAAVHKDSSSQAEQKR